MGDGGEGCGNIAETANLAGSGNRKLTYVSDEYTVGKINSL